MLTLPEKAIFIIAVIITGYYSYQAIRILIQKLSIGQGKPDWNLIPKKLWQTIGKTLSLQTVWRLRPIPSFFHALIVWGFIFYLVVNLGDVMMAFIPNFDFLGNGLIGNIYRLTADLLSVGVIVGMMALIVRRFILKPANIETRNSILLHEKAQTGIKRDSIIVGVF